MDSFEYLIALVSVVAGLGIARALSGIARLLDARHRIVFSWIPLCWTASALLWLVAFWWFTFLLSALPAWTTALHIFILVYAGSIFFLLALLHPESVPDGHDMLAHFLDNRKLFFGTFLTVGLIDLVDTWIKVKYLGISPPPLGPYALHMAPWIVFSGVAIVVNNRTFHAVFAIGLFLSFVIWLGFSIDGLFAEFPANAGADLG